jgi:hypothetical protein
MYMRPSAPRTIGGVLDDTLRLYRNAFSAWIVPAVLMAVVGFATTQYINSRMTVLVAASALSSNALLTQGTAIMHTPGLWEAYIVLVVLNLWLFTALAASMFDVSIGKAPKALDGLGIGFRLLPAGVLGSFLVGLAFVGGTILLVIPGLYIIGRMLYWTVALVDERAGATQAIGTSWKLVQGHWWRSSTVMGVLWIIAIVIGLVGAMVSGIGAALVKPNVATVQLVTQSVGGVLNIFITPLIPCGMVAVYQDLKLRAGGGDLAARISNLPPT